MSSLQMSTANVERIYTLIKGRYKLTSDKDLADFLGVDYRTLAAWKSRGRIAKIDAFIDKCSGINAQWLRTGEGEMFRDGAQGEPKAKGEVARPGAAGGEAEGDLLPLKPEDVVVMKVYVTGGAGSPFEFIPTEPIEEIVLPRQFYSKAIIPVKVRGRSMEQTLRDGAVVGVDRADRQIVNGELYAVWLPYQGTVIKRLYIDTKRIKLQSDNEEFRSNDVEIALDEVDENFIQGRVKWAIQLL